MFLFTVDALASMGGGAGVAGFFGSYKVRATRGVALMLENCVSASAERADKRGGSAVRFGVSPFQAFTTHGYRMGFEGFLHADVRTVEHPMLSRVSEVV